LAQAGCGFFNIPGFPVQGTCLVPGAGGVSAVVHATNSTISDNSSSNPGGVFVPQGSLFGVSLSYPIVDGPAVLSHVTMVDNVSAFPAAGSAVGGAAQIEASVLSGSTSLCSSSATSGGYNAATDHSCGLAQPTDLQDGGFVLGPLADNGGPTQTHLPHL